MCGVLGFVVERGAGLDPQVVGSLVRTLYRVSESRGKEAAGLALHVGGTDGITAFKAAVRGRRLLAAPEARAILTRAAAGVAAGERVVLIGHTRMVTNGDPADNGNNQPVLGDRVAVLHNGIITNEHAIWDREPDLPRRHEVDTELAVRLIERELAAGHPLDDSFAATARTIAGANTLAVLDGRTGDLAFGTANGSLHLSPVEGSDGASMLVVASEEPILRRAIRALGRRRPRRGRPTPTIDQVRPDTMVLVPSVGGAPVRRTVAFGADAPADQQDGARGPDRRVAAVASVLAELARVDDTAIARLRRCSRCVLPETFPGITFDDAGVCTVCRTARAPEESGMDGLRELLPPGTKVLFPLSGGRDSCYGLHVAVKELDLDVIAFTYDWGMVTDLARRNISRMCGALDVEHVLVSADIARKRSHVRRNVMAWLRRPELGTIPLFMAGDKQFFFHAQRLRREHRAAAILFSMNPYERTDFKVGFAGVSDGGARKDRHYDLDTVGKARVLAYYVTQMLRNPAYLNRSLVDSATGFLAYYLIPKDFFSLYEHLEWREATVDAVLLGRYGWESAPDSTTTWRIGDGTAPFYNYLYLRLAGFSENDALRSNQIRAGHLSRDEVMAHLRTENSPRIEALAWYLATIGLDAVEVIDRVNAIPTLLGSQADGWSDS